MIKLRYKFYIVLFVIFLMISASFIAIIFFAADYNRNNVKDTYYNMLYDTSKQNIVNYIENICDSVSYNLKDLKSNEIEEKEQYILDFIKGIAKDSQDFEVYLQKVDSYSESNIAVYNMYSSEYVEIDETFTYYDKNTEAKAQFYPSYETLAELSENNKALKSEIFYDSEYQISEKRTFYSRLIPELRLIVTSCFYDNDLKNQSEKYVSGLGIYNENTMPAFLVVMIFLIMGLFIFLCYIESLYYKKLETKFLSEKIKTDEKYEELKRLAETDALTKCYNRKYLNEKMTNVFRNFLQGHLPSSAILFDIDNFKRVNDTYGHSAGDAVLVQVSNAVRECIRREDILARWGGEEFVIFFKYTNIKSALIIAEKIRVTIENLTVITTEHKIKVTASIGISTFKKSDSEATDCIERADDAMYISKKTGKNKVTLYNK